MEKINKTKAIIIDSNKTDARILKKQLRSDNRTYVTGLYTSLKSFEWTMEVHSPKIIFIDSLVHTREYRKFLAIILKQLEEVLIVYIYSDNIAECEFSDYNPDFILKKPFLFSETIKIIDTIQEKIQKDKDMILEISNSLFDTIGIVRFKAEKGFVLVKASEIVCVRSVSKKCEMTRIDGTKETFKYKISEMDCVLSKHNFFKITRSLIINLEHLHMFQRKEKLCVLKHYDRKYFFEVSTQNILELNKLPFIKLA